MARHGDAPSRREISEKIDDQRDVMHEQEKTLDTYAGDAETIRGTRDGFEGGGTSEGADTVAAHIDAAENATTDAFDREDDELEQLQDESQEFGGELDERSDSADADRQRISDAVNSLQTDEAGGEAREAEDAANEDSEFLKESSERNREAREESDRIQQELQRRAHANGGC